MRDTDEIDLADATGTMTTRIEDLAGPQHITGDQYGPSVYEQVRDSLTDRRGSGGGRARGSSPVWLEGMVWVDAIDQLARDWTTRTPWGTAYPGGVGTGGTVARLRWLADQKPRPQDTTALRSLNTTLERMAHDAANLLDPVLFTVSAACPECGADHVRLPDGMGDHVRHDALRVRLFSADCAACGTRWGEAERLQLAADVAGPADTPGDDRPGV